WGFNALPNWVDTKMFHRGLPHSTNHGSSDFAANFDYIIPKTSWTGFPNVFSDLWKPYLEITLRDIEENKNDPWIIGHFFDNELEWWGKTEERGTEKGDWNMFNSTWLLPKNHTAKIAASKIIEKYLKEKNRLNDITKCFEEYFGVKNINSINDYLNSYKGGSVWSIEGKEIGALYMKEVAERYFSAIKETFQKYDKNHLYFCTRFPGSSPSIGEIVNKYCDIDTFNIYPFVSPISGVPDSTIKSVRKISNFAPDIPLMVTEWSFPALDAGLPSLVGAGTRMDNQVQKTNAVKFFMAQLMNMENVIGAHYFKYLDQSQHGSAETFQENSNYGLVNGTDYPYELLTKTLKEVNENYCRRRLGNFSYNEYLPNKEVLYGNRVTNDYDKTKTRGVSLQFEDKNATFMYKNIRIGRFEFWASMSYYFKNDTQNKQTTSFWSASVVRLNNIIESEKTVEVYYQTNSYSNKTMEVCFILPKGSVSDSTVNPFMAVRITNITDKLSLNSEIVNYRVVSTNVLINIKDFGSDAVRGEKSGNNNYWKPEEYFNVPKLNIGMGVWAFPDNIRIYKNSMISVGQSFTEGEMMDENGSFAPNKNDLKKQPNFVFFPFASNCAKKGYGCYNQSLDMIIKEITNQYDLPEPLQSPNGCYSIFGLWVLLMLLLLI
ncbi:agarase, partial [Entamoeba invadens IP1]